MPFRDHVWPKFLRENAVRVLQARGPDHASEPSNAAFDAALAAGGAIDTSVGVPKSREEMFEFYGFIRDQAQGRGVEAGRGRASRCPAGYMFKEPPGWDADELGDPVEFLIAEQDRHGITKAIVSRRGRRQGARAVREHPDRFFAVASASTRTTGMEAVPQDRAASPTSSTSSASGAFPAGLYPQVAVDDKKWFPIYTKCVELDIPFASTMGVPGPRIPFSPQDVARLDEVCWFFPELKFVTRHGCEPWTELAVKLMLKWPNLYYSTTAFAPKHYPEGHHRLREHPRRRQDHLERATSPPASATTASSPSCPTSPFRDHVWPKFLHENAVTGLQARRMSDRPMAPRGPLTGIKVLEIPSIGPTQFAGMALGDLGAEVLRLDRATSVAAGSGMIPASPYASLDRNRRSMGIDLKHPDGAETVLAALRVAPTSSSRGSDPAWPSGSASARTSRSSATPGSSTAA